MLFPILKKSIKIITADGTKEKITVTITQKDAKEIALKDAGFTEQEVTVTSEKLDVENGSSVYEIEFFKDNVKYEYEVNAGTGAIYSKSKEITVMSSADAAAQLYAEQTPSDTGKPDNTTTNPPAGDPANPQNQESSAAYIGVDKAKSIALKHAGMSASSVYFSKAKLNDDDREIVYEIEFYVGNTEYDYEIDAYSGAILEYEIDSDS